MPSIDEREKFQADQKRWKNPHKGSYFVLLDSTVKLLHRAQEKTAVDARAGSMPILETSKNESPRPHPELHNIKAPQLPTEILAVLTELQRLGTFTQEADQLIKAWHSLKRRRLNDLLSQEQDPNKRNLITDVPFFEVSLADTLFNVTKKPIIEVPESDEVLGFMGLLKPRNT